MLWFPDVGVLDKRERRARIASWTRCLESPFSSPSRLPASWAASASSADRSNTGDASSTGARRPEALASPASRVIARECRSTVNGARHESATKFRRDLPAPCDPGGRRRFGPLGLDLGLAALNLARTYAARISRLKPAALAGFNPIADVAPGAEGTLVSALPATEVLFQG